MAELGPLIDLAKDLARLDPSLSPAERRALEVLALAVLAALSDGSTRAPIEGPAIQRFARVLGADPSRVEADIAALAAKDSIAIGRDPDRYAPLIVEGGHAYTQRMHTLERRVASLIAARASVSIAFDRVRLAEALRDVSTEPLELTDEQRSAVEAACSGAITVVSGGPGTGKTSVVFALLRALVRTGTSPEQIALSAPTGKAANRMDEAIRAQLARLGRRTAEDLELEARIPRAQTLHRMLGYSPKGDQFRHGEDNRLPERAVIVDESSMIDLVLMDRLLRSLRGDARLILIGDADQLPSVGAGAVLGDARAALASRTVTLTHNHRLSSADPGSRSIAIAARAIDRGGEALLDTVARRDGADRLELLGIELLEARGDPSRRRFLDRWYRERTAGHPDHVRLTRRHYRYEAGSFSTGDLEDLGRLLAHQARFQILTVTSDRTLSTGAAAINAALHRRVVDDLQRPQAPFLIGEPVMMQRNDYERGLFNGDQGVVVSVIADGRRSIPMAVFSTPRGLLPFHLDGIAKDLDLSHAITVHKAQGSELDHVAFLLPDVEVSILTRELIYTAITRARRAVTIVGDPRRLVEAASRTSARSSGLVDRVRRAGARP
jgi:exodeoxyribonuclease V alpha subunit